MKFPGKINPWTLTCIFASVGCAHFRPQQLLNV
jgi:hypothetical protein